MHGENLKLLEITSLYLTVAHNRDSERMCVWTSINKIHTTIKEVYTLQHNSKE